MTPCLFLEKQDMSNWIFDYRRRLINLEKFLIIAPEQPVKSKRDFWNVYGFLSVHPKNLDDAILIEGGFYSQTEANRWIEDCIYNENYDSDRCNYMERLDKDQRHWKK